jgi:hypothetical protein
LCSITISRGREEPSPDAPTSIVEQPGPRGTAVRQRHATKWAGTHRMVSSCSSLLDDDLGRNTY